ncbi:hypothetical protein LguiA_004382 [Lonicera macranthoides]
MGSCISKCIPKPKRKPEQGHNLIQDKLVISQPPTSPSIPKSTQNHLSPSPSPISTSSYSSFSCTASATTSSTCSLTTSSSCSSSILSAKDRSFSNEFLWSCVQENPHIVKLDPVNSSVEKLVGSTIFRAPAKQVILDRRIGSTPQKRARANSPNVARQKSFRERKEPDRHQSSPVLARQRSFRERPQSPQSRTMRSPSPSRRFDGDSYNYNGEFKNFAKESFRKGNVVNSMRRENLRPSSPSNNLSRYEGYLRNRERFIHQNGKKIDEISVGEVRSLDKIDSIPTEDIDNPLIALDCFIFL